MSKATGFVFYRGPSQLDGAPIVGIAVLKSGNVKTGNMVQTYIMRADMPPVDAVKSGHDATVCGDCPLKPSESGVCYVVTFHGPRATYDAWERGRYPDLSDDIGAMAELLDGRMVRLGAYGDPAAVPEVYWRNMLLRGSVKGYTGYTHQWRRPEFAYLRDYCQASCDSTTDVRDAKADNWGTFYVIPPLASDRNLRVDGHKMIACPYTKVGIQCADCGLCNGKSRRNIVVNAHGAGAKKLVGEV